MELHIKPPPRPNTMLRCQAGQRALTMWRAVQLPSNSVHFFYLHLENNQRLLMLILHKTECGTAEKKKHTCTQHLSFLKVVALLSVHVLYDPPHLVLCCCVTHRTSSNQYCSLFLRCVTGEGDLCIKDTCFRRDKAKMKKCKTAQKGSLSMEFLCKILYRPTLRTGEYMSVEDNVVSWLIPWQDACVILLRRKDEFELI